MNAPNQMIVPKKLDNTNVYLDELNQHQDIDKPPGHRANP
ncbi:hypothetical protein SynNOUM97013_01785 [Synechococcus sp. NOUM97013]|nr:hypothetical protein SynNOUM97013_01785 [Synechococcus sp. NOUM97013]